MLCYRHLFLMLNFDFYAIIYCISLDTRKSLCYAHFVVVTFSDKKLYYMQEHIRAD